MENIHGQNLLKLSDDQLFQEVYLQTLDLVDSFPCEEDAFLQISPARRTFYIVSIFDMELQNGGLCQFFVNSSKSVATGLVTCLSVVGAQAHLQLLKEFASNNGIDLSSLDAFTITDIDDYLELLNQYDFAAFDDAFYNLPALEELLVDYIKANIAEF